MQPYQAAAEESIEQRTRPIKALGKLAEKALPFLNTYIPANLAMKGLSKVDSRLGKFFEQSQKMGYDIDEIRGFMRDKLNPEQNEQKQQKQPAKQDRNIIEQYSPDLHQFLLGHIKSGRQPVEAAALATLDKTGQKNFKSIIKKITQDHKIPWSELVESIYSISQSTQQQPQQTQQMQPQGGQVGQINDPLFQALMQGDAIQVSKISGVNQKQAEDLIMKFNQTQNSQQQQQVSGKGQQALMDVLQRINQKLGQ